MDESCSTNRRLIVAVILFILSIPVRYDLLSQCLRDSVVECFFLCLMEQQ